MPSLSTDVDAQWVSFARTVRSERSHVLIACLEGQARVSSRLGQHDVDRGGWLLLTGRGGVVVRCDPGVQMLVAGADVTGQCAGLGVPFPAAGALPIEVVAKLRQDGAGLGVEAFEFLLAELLWPLLDGVARCPGRTLDRRRQIFARLQTARMFLAGHLEHLPSLNEVAALANLSRCYFVRAYAGVYGVPPIEDHQGMRMRRAAHLLTHSDLSIGEIALRCGFDAGCNFARAFRHANGTTPTAWREREKPCAQPMTHRATTHAGATRGDLGTLARSA